MEKISRPDWGTLFQQMLEQPGKMPEYYSMFHQYSLGNQALAIAQMRERGIPVGPISSFNGWKKIGRMVKKGEKAISLWMPVVSTKEIEKEDGTIERVTKRFFILKNQWFALAQTEAVDRDSEVMPEVAPPPEWDKATALAALGITETPFTEVNGNIQGLAWPAQKKIAVSPIAGAPWKTLFHEMAHCILHGSDEAMEADGVSPVLSIKEAEAEAVAYLCCASLGLPGLDECRGYVQAWLTDPARREEFAKKSAARVFAAADKILKAGTSSGKKEDCHE